MSKFNQSINSLPEWKTSYLEKARERYLVNNKCEIWHHSLRADKSVSDKAKYILLYAGFMSTWTKLTCINCLYRIKEAYQKPNNPDFDVTTEDLMLIEPINKNILILK